MIIRKVKNVHLTVTLRQFLAAVEGREQEKTDKENAAIDITKSDAHPTPAAEKEATDISCSHPSMVEGVAKMQISQPKDVVITPEGNENQPPDTELGDSDVTPSTRLSGGDGDPLCMEPDSVEVDAEKCMGWISEGRSHLVPSAPDFLMSYSTLPGSVSYRDTAEGSFYIKALDEKLRKSSNVLPLDRILMNVATEVKDQIRDMGHQSRHQYPFHLQTADKLIYLKFE